MSEMTEMINDFPAKPWTIQFPENIPPPRYRQELRYIDCSKFAAYDEMRAVKLEQSDDE